MTIAAKSSVGVRKSRPRNSPPQFRRTAVKALTSGLAVVVIGSVTVISALIGAGWLLAASLQARSTMRTALALAPPPDRTVWAGLSSGGATSRTVVVAGLPAPEPSTPMQEPIGALAFVTLGPSRIANGPSSDEIHTASIGIFLAAPEIRESAPLSPPPLGLPPALPARLVEEPPVPLPQTRPRLASLAPTQDLGIKPDDDAAPRRTAVYDITAQVVYMPNGERLEAHSGLGDLMDDPRNVQRKNRGSTPPNTYSLKLRESLFHGVQAIRMTPVDESKMFGRDGILAHSYMLGPNGQSNGCISFRDYPKFLHAFLRGEVDRIVVVSRLDKPPTYAARSTTFASRSNTSASRSTAFATSSTTSASRSAASAITSFQEHDRLY